jgi:hypothetical protein
MSVSAENDIGLGGCRRSVPDGPDNSNGVELTNRSLQTAEYHHLHGDRSADHNLGTGPRGAGLTLLHATLRTRYELTSPPSSTSL